MTIREMRGSLGITQSEFAKRYNIPFRTIQNWEAGARKPPKYIIDLLEQRISLDLINRKTVSLPEYDPKKIDLPKRSDFVGSFSWLKAVRECLGDSVVFALDEALMLEGIFGGRSEEYIIWVYGDDSLSKYNGVVILGNHISPNNTKEKNGIRYTILNRTICDSFANEEILDMQGITEAIADYYYKNNESFEGIYVPPAYQKRFDGLTKEIMDYYSDR